LNVLRKVAPTQGSKNQPSLGILILKSRVIAIFTSQNTNALMKQIVFGVSARGMTTTMATRDHQIARSRNPEILSILEF
jgi:hypothetical protein